MNLVENALAFKMSAECQYGAFNLLPTTNQFVIGFAFFKCVDSINIVVSYGKRILKKIGNTKTCDTLNDLLTLYNKTFTPL